MTPFEPLAGISRRQVMVDHLSGLDYGEMVSYETLELLLDSERNVVQQAVNQAKRELEKDYRKVIEPVPGKGYRVVQPNEQPGVAVKRGKQARRKLRQSQSAVVNIDESRLSPVEKVKVETMRETLQTVVAFEKKHDLRTAARRSVDRFMQAGPRSASDPASISNI